MQKLILFILFVSSFLAVNAQSNPDALFGQTFMTKIATVCEETPDSNPCAGFEIFLVLSFSKEAVSVTEKNISSCNKESIFSKRNYTWELTADSEIIIHSNPEEILCDFLNDHILKLENETVIGYEKLSSGKSAVITFDRTIAK